MTFPRKLLVHGKMIRLVEEEGGGAGVIRMTVDRYLERGGVVKPPEKPIEITFFFPNYDPSLLQSGHLFWIHLELYADWGDLKEIQNRETWIKSLNNKDTSYEYALAGEMFQLSESGRDDDLYINAGLPVSLSLGLPPYPARRPPLVAPTYVRLSRGTLHGHVEVEDPEFRPLPSEDRSHASTKNSTVIGPSVL
jgi:hypothetical protein